MTEASTPSRADALDRAIAMHHGPVIEGTAAAIAALADAIWGYGRVEVCGPLQMPARVKRPMNLSPEERAERSARMKIVRGFRRSPDYGEAAVRAVALVGAGTHTPKQAAYDCGVPISAVYNRMPRGRQHASQAA